MTVITIGEAQVWARKKLKEGEVEAPGLDADVLLAFVTGLDRAGLYRERERVLTPREESAFSALAARRREGEPVAYLTGEKEFMGLSFAVTPDVLIPRPETELLVETALALCSSACGKGNGPAVHGKEGPGQQGCSPVLADVGAGSGAIAVSLAVNIPRALVYATDTAPSALAVAKKNAARHDVVDRVRFFCGDLLDPLAAAGLAGLVDLVAANLPYLTGAEMAALPRDVRYEPKSALNGGSDGLSLYRRLAPQAEKYLRPDGHLLIEIGPEQVEAATALFPPAKWKVSSRRDLAGRHRLLIARRTA